MEDSSQPPAETNWMDLTIKGIDILGDIFGLKTGTQTSTTGNPYPTSTNPQQLTPSPASTLTGIPQWAIYGGFGLAALLGAVLLVKALK